MDARLSLRSTRCRGRSQALRVRSNYETLEERLRRAARAARTKATAFARENDLDRKAESWKRSAKQKYVEVEEEVRRASARIDSKYQVSKKFGRWSEKFWENARDVDQRYRVRQRVTDTADDVKRRWPYIRRKLDDFSETWIGKVVVFTVFFMFLSSGLIFPLLNLLFIFWWLAPILVVPLLNYMAKNLEEESSKFDADMFSNNPFGQSPFTSGKSRQDFSAGGQVIDVDHETVDE